MRLGLPQKFRSHVPAIIMQKFFNSFVLYWENLPDCRWYVRSALETALKCYELTELDLLQKCGRISFHCSRIKEIHGGEMKR